MRRIYFLLRGAGSSRAACDVRINWRFPHARQRTGYRRASNRRASVSRILARRTFVELQWLQCTTVGRMGQFYAGLSSCVCRRQAANIASASSVSPNTATSAIARRPTWWNQSEFRRRHGVFVNTEIRDHVNKFAEPMLAHVEGEIGHHECLGIGDVFEGRYQGARRSPAAKAWVQRLLISRGSRSHSTVRAEHGL